MNSAQFEQAVLRITARKSDIHKDAYFFLKEALDLSIKRNEASPGTDSHVTAEQLLAAFRDHAIEEYGPMSGTLLAEWGIKKTADVGTMVFDLIEERMFGRQESDSESDFVDVYTFQDAFVQPFLPAGASA